MMISEFIFAFNLAGVTDQNDESLFTLLYEVALAHSGCRELPSVNGTYCWNPITKLNMEELEASKEADIAYAESTFVIKHIEDIKEGLEEAVIEFSVNAYRIRDALTMIHRTFDLNGTNHIDVSIPMNDEYLRDGVMILQNDVYERMKDKLNSFIK